MADDVILNKAASIERCLHRIEEEYADNEQNLVGNQTKQDAIVLRTAGMLFHWYKHPGFF